MTPQCPRVDDAVMDQNRDTDDAIGTAAEHAREAEQRLVGQPMGSLEQVSEAHTVHHRAEDLDVLATEAAHPESDS